MIPSLLSLCAATLAAVLATGCDTPHVPLHGGTSATAASLATGGGLPSDSISARADRGRIQGSADAPVWFIEASDFQCPFCKIFHDSAYPQIVRDYVKTGKIRMAYINFPLSIHQYSLVAAEAAMCASVQDRFWPMHDSLFASQDRWVPTADPVPIFQTLAQEVGASVPAWRSCMDSHATRPLIQADHDRGRSAGVRSTPNFFIGDQRVEGAAPFATFRDAIEAQLAKHAKAAPAH